MREPECSSDDMLTALKRVAVLLKQAEIPFALAGGYAVYARGGTHSDHDVDFVIREQDVARVVDLLIDHGVDVHDPPEDWLTKAFSDGCQVDLIYRLPIGAVDLPLLSRSDELRIDSVHMPVLSATDLVSAKLLSLTEHNCDLEPALRMVRALREQVDWRRVRQDTSPSAFARAFLHLARDLELVPHQELTDVTPRAVKAQ